MRRHKDRRATAPSLAIARLLALFAGTLAAGCGSTASDPCAGHAGTCVALSVTSRAVASIDAVTVEIGAPVGEARDSAFGKSATLPIRVALLLPASVPSGMVHLAVSGQLAGAVVGSGSADAPVTAGQHTTATVELLASSGGDGGADGGDGGGVDGSSDGSSDGGDGGSAVKPCDPMGVTGPRCVWRWQTPLPQGDTLAGVAALADSDTYAASVDGVILHRDNTGWSTLAARPTPPAGSTLHLSGFAGQGNDLYAAGVVTTSNMPQAAVFHSSDLGVTWMKETIPATTPSQLGAVATGGIVALVAAAGGTILSRDALGNWTTKTPAAATVTFLGATISNVGWVVVGSPGTTSIYYSTNFGTSWTAATTVPAQATLLSGACNGTTGAVNSFWAVGAGGVIIHSTNGAVWTLQSSSGAGLSSCTAVDATHAWAFGSNGSIVYTTDGVNWSGVPMGPATTVPLTAGSHSPGASLTVVGQSGVIFRSTNGTSFAAELSGPTDFDYAIAGAAPGSVFSVGAMGTIERTADGGKTWTKLAVPAETGTTSDLRAVWAGSPTDVYAVGGNATIVHSSNGTTFTKYVDAAIPADIAWNDVFGSPTLGVFVVGRTTAGGNFSRQVYRTTNQGMSWTPVTGGGAFTGGPPATANATSVFCAGSEVWIGTDGGKIFHSTDGTTFVAQSVTGPAAGSDFAQIRGRPPELYAVSFSPGAFFYSANGGVAWMSSTPFADQQTSLAVAGGNLITTGLAGTLLSVDQGATWSPLLTGVRDPGGDQGVFAFGASDIFITGQGVIHYGN